MRNQAQPLLGDEVAGNTANAVGLVLDTDKCRLEVLYELVLTLGKLACLFLGKLVGAIVLDGTPCITTPLRVLYSALAFSSIPSMICLNSASSSSE